MTRALVLSLIAALLAAAPLAADDAAVPMLFIESIEVRNAKRVSPDVVIAESRLREGQEYTEAELRDASTRLSRLPFLLSVEFALEKGSERGKHVLVLTINETKPFFYLLDARPFYEEDNKDYVEVDENDRLQGGGNDAALGFRWFVGRRGALHFGFNGARTDLAFNSARSSVAAGYTQYDLFGTRAFATVNLKHPLDETQGVRISPELVVGIPLSANETLTLQFDNTRYDNGTRTLLGTEFNSRQAEQVLSARWSYNTTNEPFLPTRGTLLHLSPRIAWSDGAGIAVVANGLIITAFHGLTLGAGAGASHYWELSEHDSVFGDLRGEWARNEQRSNAGGVVRQDLTYGSVGAGYSHSLWSREERVNGDSRLEMTGRFSNRTRPNRLTLPENSYPYPGRDVRQVAAGWVRRSSWGTLRVGAGYAW